MTLNTFENAAAATESAFDASARSYDGQFDSSPVTSRLRETLYRMIKLRVPAGGTIVDLGCGTGTDAVNLASLGYHVIGLDTSEGMLAQARRKGRGIQGLSFERGSLLDLNKIASKSAEVVLSNFGALNCIQNPGDIAPSIARITRAGGFFLAVVMPRVSPWEIVAGLTRANSGMAFRRFRSDAMAAGFQNGTFPVYYHSHSALRSTFGTWFTETGARGWCVVAPPPHATNFVTKFPRLTHGLTVIDRALGALPLVRGIGDHFLCVLKRRYDPSD